jgi:hypothetical protein
MTMNDIAIWATLNRDLLLVAAILISVGIAWAVMK